MAENKLSY